MIKEKVNINNNTNKEIENSFNSINKLTQNENVTKYLHQKVESFFFNKVFPDSKSKIVVGVSGGVDSVTLLHILSKMSKKFGFQLVVAHFNHRLRGKDAENDEKFVEKLAKRMKLEFVRASGNVQNYASKNSISTEVAARTLRYNFFERTTRNLNADFLATAHNKDDSAETFLINLFRGTGLTGLSGIPETRTLVKDVKLIRPLLDISKDYIIKYAKENSLKWVEDHTNNLSLYTRNKIRNELIPFLKDNFSESIIDTIIRASGHIRGADELVEDYVRTNMVKVVDDVDQDKVTVDISLLQTYSSFLKGELLNAILSKYFRYKQFNLKQADRILKLCESQTGAKLEINENIMVLKDRSFLIFSKKTVENEYYEKIKIPGEYRIGKHKITLKKVSKRQAKFTSDPNVEYFDMKFLPHYLVIRTWKQGDWFSPIGMKGSMKVSDYLTNKKVSLIDKQNVLVLTNQVDIMWVCGFRMSEKFRVTKDTKKILKVEFN